MEVLRSLYDFSAIGLLNRSRIVFKCLAAISGNIRYILTLTDILIVIVSTVGISLLIITLQKKSLSHSLRSVLTLITILSFLLVLGHLINSIRSSLPTGLPLMIANGGLFAVGILSLFILTHIILKTVKFPAISGSPPLRRAAFKVPKETNLKGKKNTKGTHKSESTFISSLKQKRDQLDELHQKLSQNISKIHQLSESNFLEKEIKDSMHDRVLTIEALHDIIQKKALNEKIDIGDFLQGALGAIQPSVPQQISLTCHITGSAMINKEIALNLGVILCESCNNAVVSAFSKGTCGQIGIHLSIGTSTIHLSILDNGRGFSEAIKKSRNGLGINLMEYCSQNISASDLTIASSTNGTSVTLSFPHQDG